MDQIHSNPLSDMGRIKESLITLLKENTDVARLTKQCFDTPYMEGIITDGCGIFLETHLIRAANQRTKEVGVNIYVACHKDSIALSEEDKTYYNSIGIYGNRVDSTIQAIHSAIIDSQNMSKIKENYSIGDLTFIEEEPIKHFMSESDFYGKQMSYTYQAFYQRKK